MRLRSKAASGALVALALSSIVAFSASSGEAADPLSRYPFDPVCPWGRIANGRGMIVRCLSQAESVELGHRSTSPPPAVAPPLPIPDGGPPDAFPTSSPADLKGLRVNADVGKLPEAEKKLLLAKDRYLECIAKNGGLEDAKAEVQVRFLVRARGRAEGVSVAKRSGVGSQAAECVAAVVDRRQVGIPDEPIVGATVILQFGPR